MYALTHVHIYTLFMHWQRSCSESLIFFRNTKLYRMLQTWPALFKNHFKNFVTHYDAVNTKIKYNINGQYSKKALQHAEPYPLFEWYICGNSVWLWTFCILHSHTVKRHKSIFEWIPIWHMGNEWARIWMWWEDTFGELLFFSSLRRPERNLYQHFDFIR